MHCNTPQHTATHRYQAATHFPPANTVAIGELSGTTRCNAPQYIATYRNTVNCQEQHAAMHCNTLQHTATHRNTLQHTSRHCSQLQLVNCQGILAMRLCVLGSVLQCLVLCCGELQ